MISASLLARLGVRNPVPWVEPLIDSCGHAGITTAPRLAAFLANILYETAMLSQLAEGLNYSAAALSAQWPAHFTPTEAARYGRMPGQPANQQMIGELAYGGRMGNGPPGCGDGYLFRGHGAMQTTGRANYCALARSIGWTMALEQLPAWLETPLGATQSAASFWSARGCNAWADAGNIAMVRRLINGGEIGLPGVRLVYLHALHQLSAPAPRPIVLPPLPRPTPYPPVSAADLNEQALTAALNQRALDAAREQRP